MADCRNKKSSIDCTCTYACARHGKCCECVEYHRERGEVPGCLFSAAGERTYDRSPQALVRDRP